MVLSTDASTKTIALAAGAHPDDIEFMMAGTLLRLKESGVDIHMWNLSTGYCGSDTLSSEETSQIRWNEARNSAKVADATIHPPISEDIDILYDKTHITKVAAVIRNIKPNIILVPAPQDYMEDHQNTSRILVTAAFVRGMKNFITSPPVETWNGFTAIYHAMPHGLRNSIRKLVRPGQYVDITPVINQKSKMLSMHKSQKDFLDITQEIGSYLSLMESMSKQVGIMSGHYEYAEGWRRHAHWGFGPIDYNPLSEILASACWTDPEYEKSLGKIIS